jgi:hypothetical protein
MGYLIREEDMRLPTQPYRLQVPGIRKNIGLGDAIKQTTTALGIKPCGGCERRAAALNRWLILIGRRPK